MASHAPSRSAASIAVARHAPPASLSPGAANRTLIRHRLASRASGGQADGRRTWRRDRDGWVRRAVRRMAMAGQREPGGRNPRTGVELTSDDSTGTAASADVEAHSTDAASPRASRALIGDVSGRSPTYHACRCCAFGPSAGRVPPGAGPPPWRYVAVWSRRSWHPRCPARTNAVDCTRGRRRTAGHRAPRPVR